MLRHKNIDRICCIVLAITVLLSAVYIGAADAGLITANTAMGYENKLFDQSKVHTIDIRMDDWESFLDTCTSETYTPCDVVIDGEKYANVAIRGKGNTSLSSVAGFGNDRYSFKIEFDRYQSGHTYHGLDKLSLNNLIYDHTYMKDYWAYTLMNKMGVASSLCSFVQISVNGEPWGFYLAVEGVEESFLQRSYGSDYGDLYKPDSMNFGGGRGNGRDFDMAEFSEEMGFSFGEDSEMTLPEGVSIPEGMSLPGGDASFDFSGSFGGSSGVPGQPGNRDESSGGESASSQGGQMPQGGMPEGSMPPNMGDFSGQAPEGMPDMGGFAAFNGTVPAMPDGASAEKFTKGFGGGGGGGMNSSSDVKLQYIDDDPESYPNIFDSAKTNVTEADQTRLIASLKALSEGDTAAVDMDAVIRYMAVHNFLVNDDSYTGMMVHNYYLYEEDGQLSMIPWDYNLAFGGMSATNATSAVNTPIDDLISSMGGFGASGGSDRPMAAWIMNSEEAMAQYHAFYQQFMDEVFNSGWFEAEFDRVAAMIDPYVQNDRDPFCTYEEFQTASATLREFCLRRAESICGQLDGSIPATSAEQRSATTLVDASDLDVSAMGSMNGGMGKGFGGGSSDGERPGRTERTERTERTDRSDASKKLMPMDSAQPSGGEVESLRPTGDLSGFAGMNRSDQGASAQQEQLAWLIGCAALLAAAILLAMRRRTWQ